jgi:DNA-directed RNA polymerase omega subunit
MDLISLPIEFDKEKIDGNYRVVVAAIKRAKDLAQGMHPKLNSKSKKVTTIALEEIVSGSLNVLTGEAAAKASEEARKLGHKRMIDEIRKRETLPEDLSELEKDLKVYLTEKGERDSKKEIEDIFGDSAI